MSDARTELEAMLGPAVGEPVHATLECEEDLAWAWAAHRALEALLAQTEGAEELVAERPRPAFPADYEIERVIGEGGMGVVYLAHQ